MPGWAISLMSATAISTALMAAVLVRQRSLIGAPALALVCASVSWWAGTYAAELAVAPSDVPAAVGFGDLKYLGITVLLPSWLVFALQYTGRRRLVTRRLLMGLAVHPVVMAVLLAVPATDHLVRGARTTMRDGVLDVSVGPLFWVHFGYLTLLLGVGTVVLIRALLAVSDRYRAQAVALSMTALLPWLTNLSFAVSLTRIDLTPVAFGLFQLVYVWGLRHFQLFALVPVARSSVVEHLPQPILVLDALQRVVDANASAHRLLEPRSGQLVGMPLSAVLPSLGSVADGTGVAHVRLSDPDDGVLEFQVDVTHVGDARSGPPGRVVVLHDVTERRRTERRMEHVTSHDLLTDLPNRRLLDRHLARAMANAATTGRTVGIAFVDLDGFKRLNDHSGHDVGDFVLRQVAQAIRDAAGPSTTTARWGGDEFVVLMGDLEDASHAHLVSRRLRDAAAQPIGALGDVPALSASVGVATSPPLPRDAEVLLRAADQAMYAAKSAGGRRVVHADALPPRAPAVLSRSAAAGRASDPPGPDDAEDRRSWRM